MAQLPDLSAVQALSRLAALREYAPPEGAPDAAFDRLTRLATRLLKTPVALVSLVDAERQFFMSCLGLPEPWASRRETPLSHSFCQYVVATNEPLIISDTRVHSFLSTNPAIADLDVVAYIGFPLVTSGGFVLGSFCAIDSVPHEWSADDIETLRDLAALVMTQFELRRDMLLRERAEAALHESNARFVSAFAGAAIGMALVAPDGRWLQVNQSASALLGYSESELLATDFQSVTHPDDLSADLELVERTLQGERSVYHIEKRYIHKQGHVVWVLLSVSLVRTPAGAPLYFVSQLQDITARKQAEWERERLIEQLKEALGSVKVLEGLLPICANCKKIRDDTGYWNQIEAYIQHYTDAQFSHSICPHCIEQLYPDLQERPANTPGH